MSSGPFGHLVILLYALFNGANKTIVLLLFCWLCRMFHFCFSKTYGCIIMHLFVLVGHAIFFQHWVCFASVCYKCYVVKLKPSSHRLHFFVAISTVYVTFGDNSVFLLTWFADMQVVLCSFSFIFLFHQLVSMHSEFEHNQLFCCLRYYSYVWSKWCCSNVAQLPLQASPHRGDLTLSFAVDRVPLRLWRRQDGVYQEWWHCICLQHWVMVPAVAPHAGGEFSQNLSSWCEIRCAQTPQSNWDLVVAALDCAGILPA